MKTYCIHMKSRGKLYAFHFGDLPYKSVFWTDGKQEETDFYGDKVSHVKRFYPGEMFATRKGGFEMYRSIEEAEEKIKWMLNCINNDQRLDSFIKSKAVDYINTFQIKENS